MKIAVTATGATLEAPLDPRFGRCPYFVIVETDNLSFKAVPNPNATADSGAGIQAAQNVAKLGAKAVLTGNVGPNAFKTLSAASIRMFLIKEDITVKQALAEWKEGKLPEINESTIEGHWV